MKYKTIESAKIQTIELDTANSTKSSGIAKSYETPVLVAYGDVRDITLGGSLGEGESSSGGGPTIRRVFIP